MQVVEVDKVEVKEAQRVLLEIHLQCREGRHLEVRHSPGSLTLDLLGSVSHREAFHQEVEVEEVHQMGEAVEEFPHGPIVVDEGVVP